MFPMKIHLVCVVVCLIVTVRTAKAYKREPGYCMWYGQCGTNPSTRRPVNCLYNGEAKPVSVNDSKSLQILEELCPELIEEGTKRVCCDVKQLVSLQSGIQSAQQMMARCPGCWKNFRQLYCQMTCSPNNSMFLDPTTLSADNKSIIAIDYYTDEAFRDGMYNSCKNVIFPSSNTKIMNFMCGTTAKECNALKFLRFMGDPQLNGVSPFLINYPINSTDPQIKPMYVNIKLCNETMFEPFTNSTSDPCSCQDCTQSCAPLPHYSSKTEWELDIGDIHFHLISFVALLVYLAFLVLFIAGSILYYKFSGKSYKTYHKHPKSFVGDQKQSNGLLAALGKKMDETIKHVFTCWGNICCNYPIFVIIGAVAFVVICSIGLTKFTVITDPVKLWSSPGSRARQEKATFDKNFSPFFRTAQIIFSLKPGSQFLHKPCYKNYFSTHCLLTGKILHHGILRKVLDLQNHLINMKVDYGSENVTLQDICKKPMAPHNNNCTVMSVLQYWQNDAKKLDKCMTVWPGHPACKTLNETDILASWGDHLQKCADNPSSTNDTTVLGLPCTSLFGAPVAPSIALGGYEGNNYTDAKNLIVTIIINNHEEASKNKKAMAWEKAFIDYMKAYKNDSDLDVAFMAERSIEDEIERESHADIYTIIVSYVIMFLYITIALGQINQCDRFMIDSKFSLAFGGIIIVLASVLSSLGIFSYANYSATLIIIEVIPFLVLAVGVDNIFILVQKYQRDIRQPGETVSKQIGRVLGGVAPSLLLTSTSEAVAFAFGALSSMPAVQVFSLYASVAVFLNFLLQVTCFVALMSLDVRRQQSERYDVLCCIQNLKVPKVKNKPSLLYQFFDKLLSPALLSEYVRPAVVIFFTTLLAFSIMFIPSIEVGLDKSLSLPKDSYLIHYFKEQSANLKVGSPVYFVVNNPKYPYQLREWQNKICGVAGCDKDSLIQTAFNAYRLSEHTKIGLPPSSWLDDYFSWADPSGKYPCCRLLDFYINKTGHKVIPKAGTFCNASMTESCYTCHSCLTNKQIGQRPNTTQFSKYLPYFLKDNPEINCTKGGHAAYSDAVILNPTSFEQNVSESPVKISRFMGYHTILKTSADFTDALKNARKLSEEMSKKTESHVFAYSIFYVFYEQYLTIVHDSWVNLVVCLASIFAMTFLLMGFQVRIAFMVTFTVAMIVTDIMGMMYLWDISLNAVSLVNLVMAVGISVEFCSHIARHFTVTPGKCRIERARLSLAHMGSSVFSGITLTKFGGIIVLAFSSSQIFEVFYFRMYLGIVLFGASHGLLFLPVFLSYIGPDCRNDGHTLSGIQDSSYERDPLVKSGRDSSNGSLNGDSNYGTNSVDT